MSYHGQILLNFVYDLSLNVYPLKIPVRFSIQNCRIFMELENELSVLCHRFFHGGSYEDNEADEITHFFNKVIQKQQKIQITNEIREFIPILANYKNGIFCNSLETCIDGISPLHFVPELNLKTTAVNKPKIKRPNENNENSLRNTVKFAKTIKTGRAPRRRKIPYTAVEKSELEDLEKTIAINNIVAPPLTARPFHSTTRFKTTTFKKPLPPLKENQSNVLPSLFIKDRENFYIAVNSETLNRQNNKRNTFILDQSMFDKEDKYTLGDETLNHDLNILPPDYPENIISGDFAVISANGVVMTDGKTSSVVDLGQFVNDISKTYIVERQMFRLRHSYRFFYTWREMYKDRLFKKIIHEYDKKGAIGRPGFTSFMDKIREDIINETDDLMPIYPDNLNSKNSKESDDDSINIEEIQNDIAGKSSDNDETDSESEQFHYLRTSYSAKRNSGGKFIEFSDLEDIASSSISKIEERIRLMAEDTGRQLVELFKQIRAANLLMQLDFEELHSLNSLPPSLQTFASDLKWRVPSLFRQRLRENTIKKERKLSGKRQEYMSFFFTRVRVLYSGLLINQCRKCLSGFFDRFLANPHILNPDKRLPNKITANFDSDDGIIFYPKRRLFIRWVEKTIEDIKSAFLSDNKQINIDVISDINPENEFEVEDPFKIIERYPEINKMRKEAFNEINCAYNHFEKEITPHISLFKEIQMLSNEAKRFSDFRHFGSVEALIASIENAKANLEKKPKNLYHTLPENDEITDFILDMKPLIEEASDVLKDGISIFKKNFLNDLNIQFSQIQEQWARLKEKGSLCIENLKSGDNLNSLKSFNDLKIINVNRIDKYDCSDLENKITLFAKLTQILVATWQETYSDIKASFETMLGVYRGLNDHSKYCTQESINILNGVSEKIGISSKITKNQCTDDREYEYEYEYEEEEDNISK